MQEMSIDIKEMWLFWRIVIFGMNETFESADRLTLNEILQYNQVLDLKEQVTKIINTTVGAGK